MEDTMIKINGKTINGNQEGGLSGIKLFFMMMLLVGQLAGSPAQSPNMVALAQKNQLVRIFEYRDSLEGVHPFLKGLFPIAEANHLYVFDSDEPLKNYRLLAFQEIEMKIPKGIRAAFPLQLYDNDCAYIVSGEVYNTPMGNVTVFHEIIHRRQWNNIELVLRDQYPFAQKEDERGDYMWEMNHHFPYADVWFEKTYTQFITAAENRDHKQTERLRHELAEILNDDDYRYVVLQEWKEGFALFIENKLRRHLSLPANRVGRQTTYNRNVFSAGGEAFITLLTENEPELQTDIVALFAKMF